MQPPEGFQKSVMARGPLHQEQTQTCAYCESPGLEEVGKQFGKGTKGPGAGS